MSGPGIWVCERSARYGQTSLHCPLQEVWSPDHEGEEHVADAEADAEEAQLLQQRQAQEAQRHEAAKKVRRFPFKLWCKV